jgi:hypothetical protein
LEPKSTPKTEVSQVHAVAVAYHGCHVEVAQRILSGEPFIHSKNKYDWLGEGVYFWEDAPHRAWEWADRNCGVHAAVLKAEIRLGLCLNLLDTRYFEGLQRAYDLIVERNQRAGRKMPRNTDDKRHYLDKVVIDEFCEAWERHGVIYQTVRGCFPEGAPIYEGSKILRETHVQIAVRDIVCISSIELVE